MRREETKTESDESLFALHVAGQTPAFRALFDRHAAWLLRFYRASGLADADAKDLVQQVFLQLHRSRNDFTQGAALRPWLVTIAVNLRRDHARHKSRWRLSEVDESLATREEPESSLASAQVGWRVREALARLPPEQREAIELHWFGELPFREIATALGVSEAAVKVRAHRGYARLRDLVSDLLPTMEDRTNRDQPPSVTTFTEGREP